MREWDDSLIKEYEINDDLSGFDFPIQIVLPEDSKAEAVMIEIPDGDNYPIPVEDVEISVLGTFNPSWLSPWVDLIRKQDAKRKRQLAYSAFFLILIGLVVAGFIFVKSGGQNKADEASANPEALLQNEARNETQNKIIAESFADGTFTTGEPVIYDEAQEKLRLEIAAMSKEEKAARLFIVTADALCGKNKEKSADEMKSTLSKYPVYAVVFTADNIGSKKQLTKTINQLRKSQAYPLQIGIADKNEESEVIKRLEKNNSYIGFDDVFYTTDSANAYDAGYIYGGYLSGAGINFTFGPASNLEINEDPMQRGVNVYAYSQGLKDAGVDSLLYAFPGEGAADGDAYSQAFILNESLADLKQKTFQPFSSGMRAGAKYIMVSSVRLQPPAGDGKQSVFSDVVIWQYLRGVLGFNGLVVTAPLDILEKNGGYTKKDIVIAALHVGADLLYIENADGNFFEYYRAVLTAMEDGSLPESVVDETLIRILENYDESV